MGRQRPWRKGERRPPKESLGLQGWKVKVPGVRDGVPEPTTGSSAASALSRATPAEAECWAHPGERLLTSGMAPIFPHLLGWQGPPSVGRQRLRHSAPASSRVTWAAGSGGGGCRLSTFVPRGLRLQAPALPPLPGPDSGPWRQRPSSRGLRGAQLWEQGPLITVS